LSDGDGGKLRRKRGQSPPEGMKKIVGVGQDLLGKVRSRNRNDGQEDRKTDKGLGGGKKAPLKEKGN